jgi:hypothetical protein
MKHTGDMASVKALLQARIEDLVRQVAPEGKLDFGYWFAKNPARSDNRPGSFWIIVARPGKTPGAWRDEATGDKGDVIDLIAYCTNTDRSGALKWAKAWLNFETLPEHAVRAAEANQRCRNADAERLSAEVLERNRKRAFAVFVDAKQAPFLGSMADVYLRSRGIDVRGLPRMPGSLAYLPRGHHVETKTHWPVLVAGMSDDHGIKAVHRTFLMPDGSGKAPVTPARKIWPSFAGLAIRLWRGETGLPPPAAAKQGLIDTLCVCEGVEDGLSIALARPDLRVWAAGSLGNLAHIRLPECCDRVIVAADNDWGKPQAEAALNRALEALVLQGREVRVARSPIGKDMNDALRGMADAAA